jgi:hypothetical protein
MKARMTSSWILQMNISSKTAFVQCSARLMNWLGKRGLQHFCKRSKEESDAAACIRRCRPFRKGPLPSLQYEVSAVVSYGPLTRAIGCRSFSGTKTSPLWKSAGVVRKRGRCTKSTPRAHSDGAALSALSS